MSLTGKVAIVTGGASGIGRASALLLGAHGATVVVADRDAAGAAAAAAAIVDGGGGAIAIAGDIGASADARGLVERTVAEYGQLDVLVHSAGICPRHPFLQMTDEDWREVQRVNLDGTFYVTQATARAMVARGAGTIVLITSDRGVYGSIDYAHYAAAKGGTIALTRSLALTLGKHGVTVNGINPGLTDTPLGRAANPQWASKMEIDVLGRCSLPEEIAEMVLFLAGTAGRFMTGQILSTRMRFGQ